jgi:acetyl-CoA carboxylase biotin carboxylase subunit
MEKVAIANRGEIAVRIARACRDAGLVSLLLCSEVDRNSLAARVCDEVFVMRGLGPRDAYLDVDAVVAAALQRGADALHPGYGFLSENARLAESCTVAGITFIGPSARHIDTLGNKNQARAAMASSGVPLVQGSDPLESLDEARAAAERIGYPLLIKASMGGGGRGMRRVTRAADLASAFESARSEARSAFGSPAVFLEKYVERPRHIEVQIAADKHGNVVHLFERECSVQRRFQKLIEEAPSSFLDEATRHAMGQAAVRGAQAIGYDSLGTFEFLVDADRSFYFLEVNTRLQVEHPVTEEITGIDLVRLQMDVASGKPLPFRQEDIAMRGWAFEARVTCEDATVDFLPQPGRLAELSLPQGPGLRIDTGFFSGAEIPPYYDSLIAKIVVSGADREEARRRMLRALEETVIGGVPSSVPFHRWAFANEAFARGDLSTHFIEEQGWAAQAVSLDEDTRTLAAALVAVEMQRRLPAQPYANGEAATRWRLAGRTALQGP